MPTTTSTPSWPVKQLLLSLPLAFLFLSCEEPTDIGLNVQPDSQVGVLFMDFSPVEAKTILLDSVETTGSNNLTTHLVGQVEDNYFGNVTAKTYIELRLKDAGFEVGDNPLVDNVQLRLNYLGAYGDKSSQVNLRVHELANNLAADSGLYAFNEAAIRPAVLGNVPFTPSSKSPSASRREYITLSLGNDFGRKILRANMSDHSTFRDSIKGIAIVPASGNAMLSLGFGTDSDSSFVQINYRTDNGNGSPRILKLYLDRPAKRYHSIKADRTGLVSPLAGLSQSGDTVSSNNGEVFVQAGIGIRTVLKFPGLEELREQIGAEIAVNNARLILPVMGDTAEFTPPGSLFVAKASGNRPYRQNGIVQLVPLDRPPVAVEYERARGHYSAGISTYLQSVLYGREENRGIIVYPAFNSTQANRVRLRAPGPDGIKLRIYYTRVE